MAQRETMEDLTDSCMLKCMGPLIVIAVIIAAIQEIWHWLFGG